MSKKRKKNNNTSNEEVKIEENNKVKEEVVYEKTKKSNNGFMNISLLILLIGSLIYFIMNLFYGNGDEGILSIVGSFLLLLFTSLFVCIGFTIGKRKKSFWTNS